MILWVATGNKGKLAEFKLLLKNLGFELKSQSELPTFFQPPENGQTFLDNARIKARALKSVVPEGDWVLADDSGICVEGLNNLPGVHSARYAGEKASSGENNAKLLKMLQIRSPQNRKAYFDCTLVLLSPNKEEQVFSGQVHGTIAPKETGKTGFGYDPLFIPEGHQKTFGEMTDAEKNVLSHRYQACQKLLEFFKKN